MSEDARMKDLRQWVCWRHEERGGKPTKVPYSPRSGARASTENPFTWGTFDEAKHTSTQSYDGVGFVFTAQDPFCGVDLDHCLNPETGQIDPWAAEILADLDSYTEVSPSGTGLHVIVRARLPEGGRRKDRIEMYDQGRFFTVTGRHLPGAPRQVEHRQDRIDALHTRVFRDTALDLASSSVPSAAALGNGLDDEEILSRARSAANGERFAALWKGDRTGYASDSEAVLALCSMLAFWAGSDEGRISSLFSRSGLIREKWNREDYRKRTIARALAGTTGFYSPDTKAPERNPGGQVEGGGTAETPVPVPPPSLPDAPAFPV